MNKFFFIALLCVSLQVKAQLYPPPAGQPGSSAIYKDSAAFVNWANACKVHRGFMDISNPALGVATVGDSSMVLGKAGSNGVLSLGDGGWATCEFPFPIRNGPGFDFAVFENSFDDYFLELALVEVSSDGVHFFTFPSHSLTDTLVQVAGFDSLDAMKLNNLAGKYRGQYGTPFDLQELAGHSQLDLEFIQFVRIKDVVGSILPQYASRDAFQNKINDPWPSPFPSSGFDLDAVGVIHQNTTVSLAEQSQESECFVFPNPTCSDMALTVHSFSKPILAFLTNQSAGSWSLPVLDSTLVLPDLPSGLYVLELKMETGWCRKKIVLQN